MVYELAVDVRKSTYTAEKPDFHTLSVEVSQGVFGPYTSTIP